MFNLISPRRLFSHWELLLYYTTVILLESYVYIYDYRDKMAEKKYSRTSSTKCFEYEVLQYEENVNFRKKYSDFRIPKMKSISKKMERRIGYAAATHDAISAKSTTFERRNDTVDNLIISHALGYDILRLSLRSIRTRRSLNARGRKMAEREEQVTRLPERPHN